MQRQCGVSHEVRRGPQGGQVDPLEKGKATHSSILAWRVPWQRSLVHLGKESSKGLPDSSPAKGKARSWPHPSALWALEFAAQTIPTAWGTIHNFIH